MPVKTNKFPEVDEETTENLKRFLEQTKKAPTYKQKKTLDDEEEDLYDNTNLYDQNYPSLDGEEYEDEEDAEIQPQVKKSKVEFKVEEQEEVPLKQRFKKKNTSKPNPLLGYYREPGVYLKLPSQGNFNDEDFIDFSVTGEVAVYPLTAKDELWLKNPDALANGAAIEKVLQSCVPDIKSVRELPINDVSALLLAMKFASYGEELSLVSKCPKCGTENHFSVDINELLGNMSTLKSEYIVTLPNKIKVSCKPYTYDLTTQAAIISFEEAKLFQILEREEVSEDEKKEALRNSFAKIQDLGFMLTAQSIIKVVTPEEAIVRDTESIFDWLCNIERKSYNKIKDQITEINSVGVPKSVDLTCANEKCKHVYPVDITFDPSNFFE